MDAARYYIALIITVSFPSALMYWLLVHPLAHHWRRLGPSRTAMFLGAVILSAALALFHFRQTLLGGDLGFSAPLTVLGALFMAGALAIGVQVWKQMPISTLLGRPELDSRQHPGKLLTSGIYARTRHPRYVETMLGLLGCVLFANYVGLYVVFAACLPVLYLVVILEERELRQRFGPAYDAYARNVPRFCLRLKSKSPTRDP